MCQEFCPQGWGVCLSAYWDTTTTTPWEQALPRSRHPPPEQSMIGHTVNKQAVRILLECNLVFTCVCDSVHRGGSAPLHAGIHPPQDQRQASPSPDQRQAPPRADTPVGPVTPHPGPEGTPQEQTPPQTRHPPSTVHAGRYGQQAGSTHPTGMQSCFCFYNYSRSTLGDNHRHCIITRLCLCTAACQLLC